MKLSNTASLFRRISWRVALTCAFVLVGAPLAFGQSCPATTINVTGVVNDYWAGTGTVAAAATTVTLGTQRSGVDPVTSLSPPGSALAVGDLILLVQMQDATINTTNTTNYGAGTGTSIGFTALGQTGQYHFARVTVASGSSSRTTATSTPKSTARDTEKPSPAAPP